MRRKVFVLAGIFMAIVALGFVVAGATFAQTPQPNRGGNYGPGGMMGGGPGSGGMMGGGPGSGGMMGGYYTTPAAQTLTIAEAKDAATRYLANYANKNLVVDEIMLFDNNAYVAIKDSSTGVGAFELLVNPTTKQAFPEYGPNMMWNLLYGHMSGSGYNNTYPGGYGGMMGNGRGGMMGGQGMMGGLGQVNPATYQPGKMPVTADQALKAAQSYLDKSYPGTNVDKTADEFPGYYTIEVLKDGKVSGMLSVNGFTGQVWYHIWHGKFLESADYGG